MPEKKGPNLGLTGGYVTGENGWGGPMTESLLKLDTLVGAEVESMGYTEPPVEAIIGKRYIVAPGATKQWLNQDNAIALRYDENTWKFYKPNGPWRVRCKSLDAFIYWDQSKGEVDDTGKPTGAWINELTGDPVESEPDPQQGRPYEIGISAPYHPQSHEYLLYTPMSVAAILRAAGAGCQAKAMFGGEEPVTVDLLRNTTVVGRITFPAGEGEVVGDFDIGGPVTFGITDTCAVRMPVDVPPSFQIVGIVLRFTLLGNS